MSTSIRAALSFGATMHEPLGQSRVAFIAGCYIVSYSIIGHDYKFISLSEQVTKVMAYKLSPNGKFLALAEICAGETWLSVYAFTGERKSVRLDSSQINVTGLAMSQDSASFIVATCHDGARNRVIAVDFVKGKAISDGQLAGEALWAALNPHSAEELAVVGDEFIHIIRVHQRSLIVEKDSIRKVAMGERFIFGEWCPDGRFILSSEQNLLLLSSVYQLEHQLLASLTGIQAVAQTRSEIIAVQKNLCSTVFQLDSLGKFTVGLKFTLSEPSLNHTLTQPLGVKAFPEEKQLLYLMSNCDLLVAKLEGQAFQTYARQKQTVPVGYQLIRNSGGEEKISCVCIAEQSTVACIAALNQPILTVLNLETMASIAKRAFSAEGIKSVAIDGVGNTIAVAFAQGVKMFHLLATGLKQFCELGVKGTIELRFSGGGHLLAVLTSKGKSSMLMVYRVASMELVRSYRVQAAKEVSWDYLDSGITLLSDETVQSVSLAEATVAQASLRASSKSHFRGQQLIIQSGNLSFWRKGSAQSAAVPVKSRLSWVASTKELLYGGNERGQLLWSTGIDLENGKRLAVHLGQFKGAVSGLRGWLVCWDESSLIVVSREEELHEESDKDRKHHFSLVGLLREDFQEYSKRIRNLEQRLEGLGHEFQHKQYEQMAADEAGRQKLLKEAGREIENWRRRYEELKEHKKEMEKAALAMFKQMEDQQVKCLEEVEGFFRVRLEEEREKVIQLEQTTAEERQERLRKLETKHEKDIEELRAGYERRIKAEFRELEAYRAQMEQVRRQQLEAMSQQEQQSVLELVEVQREKDSQIERLEKSLASTKNSYHEAVARSAGVVGQLQARVREHEGKEAKIERLTRELREAKERLVISVEEVQSLKRVTGEQELEIVRLKQLQEQSRKGKYVLALRAQELKTQVEPNKKLIDGYKEEIVRLEEELGRYSKQAFVEGERADKLDRQLNIARKEAAKASELNREREAWINHIILDLQNIISKDREFWNKDLLLLFQKYSRGLETVREEASKTVQSEMARQLVHLENSLLQARTNNSKFALRRNADVVKKYRENGELIKDLNMIRQKVKEREQDLKRQQVQINALKKEVVRPVSVANPLRARNDSQEVSRTVFIEEGSLPPSAQAVTRGTTATGYATRPSTRKYSAQGAVRKGTNFDAASQQMADRSRLFQMASELESCQRVIRDQGAVIKDLSDRLQHQDL